MVQFNITNNSTYPVSFQGVEIPPKGSKEADLLVKKVEESANPYLQFERVDTVSEEEPSSQKVEEVDENQDSSNNGGEE